MAVHEMGAQVHLWAAAALLDKAASCCLPPTRAVHSRPPPQPLPCQLSLRPAPRQVAGRSSPALPMAAAKPWHMARISVGTISAGSSQVVALGPNWPQKELK